MSDLKLLGAVKEYLQRLPPQLRPSNLEEICVPERKLEAFTLVVEVLTDLLNMGYDVPIFHELRAELCDAIEVCWMEEHIDAEMAKLVH